MASRGQCIHWTAALLVLLVDLALVATTITVDKVHHVPAPTGGAKNTSALIGWLGVVSAIFVFGSYGILIKTPSVVEAKVDAVVFQLFVSAGTALTCLVIWAFAGQSEGLAVSPSSYAMGLLFAVLWITSGTLAYNGIQTLGYAVGPAIWIAVTMITSFVWGAAVFHNPVASWPGACLALITLVTGVCIAAASSHASDRYMSTAREEPDRVEHAEISETIGNVGDDSEAPSVGLADSVGGSSIGFSGDSEPSSAPLAGQLIMGVACCMVMGLFNGSLMVPLSCFQNGCSAIGVPAFKGTVLAPIAFLPSVALGIITAQPVYFALFYRRLLLAGKLPEMHLRTVWLPGLLTGVYWGIGNFSSMFATIYLGQTVGFPLTQCCLLVAGLWGILYYREICGRQAVGLFFLAAVVITSGAVMVGKFC